MPDLVRLDIQDEIAWLVLDNPPVNALNDDTKTALDQALNRLEEAKSRVRAVILTGEGESFVGGSDIKKFLSLTSESATKQSLKTQRMFRRLEEFVRPTIAAVNGYCFGAGLELAMVCDIRIAAETAVLGSPEVGLGIIPGAGATQRLPRLVGLGRAKELILTGRRVKADEAIRIGLVEAVVPAGNLRSEAERMANTIARKGPLAVAAAKKVMNDGWDLPIEMGLELESKTWGSLFDTEDQKEGTRAFLDKRPPKFVMK